MTEQERPTITLEAKFAGFERALEEMKPVIQRVFDDALKECLDKAMSISVSEGGAE